MGRAARCRTVAAQRGNTAVKYLVLALIRFYQLTLSRMMPPSCRYEPSCSRYTYEAVQKYGAFKGGWMGLKRIGRCHPLSPGGYDPVP
ncbi:MAG: membrane protein insertion efficiency factor YidD [Chloroflexi bacterium]|nr:membrane protein insertion efficiency factor YidD [Chloroflexota bacterium]